MTQKNAEYDFKWCPGCGDFGVRRALQDAIGKRIIVPGPAKRGISLPPSG